MALITSAHFGGNLILHKDSLEENSAFSDMAEEITLHHLRYPGGAVTENATWENGRLEKIFGDPIEPGSNGYVLTIREALSYSAEHGTGLTIVVPTKQFYNHTEDSIDKSGFDRYISELTKALLEFPDAKITAFEIGNEYWGDGPGGPLTAKEYGHIANEMVPVLHEISQKIADGAYEPGIGIQAGSSFGFTKDENGRSEPTGSEDSKSIAAQLDEETRGLITHIYQHNYPNSDRQSEWQVKWAMDPMKVFLSLEGFSSDLILSMSEFNISPGTAVGVEQGAKWIEEFSARIDAGVDEFMSWGLNYEWLSSKFYDTKFPEKEADGGRINAIATPMGQTYDIAENYLIGKSTMLDQDAVAGIGVGDGVNVTGFEDSGQRIVFLYNESGAATTIDLSDIDSAKHISTYHLISADSPLTPNYDESLTESVDGSPIDSRADMHLDAGKPGEEVKLDHGEMVVVVISDQDRDLILEGAHHVTDPSNGMVDDFIAGGSGDDIIRGHVGDDTLSGGGGRNIISGGAGNDAIVAGDDGDVVFTGEGHDTVTGGDGDDVIIVDSSSKDSETIIESGDGADAVLIGNQYKVVITDFSDDDVLGFDGYFSDAEALRDSTQIEGNDLIISLEDGGSVTLTDAADRLDTLHNSVLDFKSPEEIAKFNDSTFDGLTKDQVNELYDNVGSVDGIHEENSDLALSKKTVVGDSENGKGYWEGRDASLARSDHPIHPDPEKPTDPDDDHPSDPDDEDDDPDVPEDPKTDDEKPEEGGGACFVATAAFGDRLHPDVVALRAFRDIHLRKFFLGRVFVRIYWRIGPIMARYTKPYQFHARVFRKILSGFVRFVRRIGLKGV